ncbi:hypothetical protein AQJ46_48450 [Streptomyces canus]|uniref:Vegetative cell wall protein gp1 n=1 Tax=Streptomyces canus TaxID=58343 RepID=A0A101RKK9_9ACTN|nr:hypothetical protein [Streptomyces canus]KUN57213.1 hypothetical protein AQJ46_48450 [Streptomyces canus]
MGSLWGELGKKLAERWLSLLVLPGALYLSVAVAARALGQSHPFAVDRVTGQVTRWADAPTVSTVGGQVVLLAAVLAGASAAGLAAQALGSLVEQLHLAADWHTWPAWGRWPADRLTTHRRERWKSAARAWRRRREEAAAARSRGLRADPATRYAAGAAMTRISLEEPDRPTWSGDRIHASAVRMQRDYNLDLAVLWPHLWLVLPETARNEITLARQALTRATTLSAWGVLYLPLVALWWPAGVIAVVLALISWRRTRSAADIYATLLEAAARLHTRDVAEHLGLALDEALDRDSGSALALRLTHSPPPIPDETS